MAAVKCAFLPQAPSKEGFRSLPSHPPPLRPPRATPPSRRAPLLPGAPPPPAQFRFAEAPSSDSRIIEFLKISCTGQLLRPEAARAGIPGPQGRGSCPLMLRPLALLAPGREANGRANLPGPALRFHTKRKLADLCKSRLLCEALYTRHRMVRRGRKCGCAWPLGSLSASPSCGPGRAASIPSVGRSSGKSSARPRRPRQEGPQRAEPGLELTCPRAGLPSSRRC